MKIAIVTLITIASLAAGGCSSLPTLPTLPFNTAPVRYADPAIDPGPAIAPLPKGTYFLSYSKKL